MDIERHKVELERLLSLNQVEVIFERLKNVELTRESKQELNLIQKRYYALLKEDNLGIISLDAFSLKNNRIGLALGRFISQLPDLLVRSSSICEINLNNHIIELVKHEELLFIEHNSNNAAILPIGSELSKEVCFLITNLRIVINWLRKPVKTTFVNSDKCDIIEEIKLEAVASVEKVKFMGIPKSIRFTLRNGKQFDLWITQPYWLLPNKRKRETVFSILKDNIR